MICACFGDKEHASLFHVYFLMLFFSSFLFFFVSFPFLILTVLRWCVVRGFCSRTVLRCRNMLSVPSPLLSPPDLYGFIFWMGGCSSTQCFVSRPSSTGHPAHLFAGCLFCFRARAGVDGVLDRTRRDCRQLLLHCAYERRIVILF